MEVIVDFYENVDGEKAKSDEVQQETENKDMEPASMANSFK